MEDGRLRRVLREKIGLNLEADKRYLLESRLRDLMEKNETRTFDQIADRIEIHGDRDLLELVTNRMTTRETRFFRDENMFETFTNHIYRQYAVRAEEGGPVRIWSAGCSSGQEPYSLAMSLLEHFGPNGHPFTIEATDISDEALDKARKGIYSEFELSRGVQPGIRARYFESENKDFRIVPRIRSLVTFNKLNFLHLKARGPYDVIFFRNVAIYFEEETRRRIYETLHHSLRPGGVLVLGSTETAISYLEEMRILEFGSARFYIR